MKTGTVMMVVVVMVAALAGCASQNVMPTLDARLNRPGLVTPEQARRLEAALTDKQIADMLDADVRAKMPTPLAVARLADDSTLAPDGYRHSSRSGNLRLGIVAGAELEGWEKAVAREKDITGLRVISPGILSSGEMTLHGLRAAAAQMGCELLLVYLQVDGSVDNTTDAAALYWTLIGLWTAQGNVYERKTVIQAALLDCRTGMILGTSGGECSMKTAYAPAFEKTARDKLDSQVPGKALADVQKNSAQMLAQVVAAADRKVTTATRPERD